LLLHACCAPCSSYVLEYLCHYFDITLFFYNPNIAPESEYRFRAEELRRLIAEMPAATTASFVEGNYDPERFYEITKGLEQLPEGGERCFRCYRLRLEETARYAAANGFDYFTTTLSISPYKNAAKLNTIGAELAEASGVAYLFSDFKKKGGYLRSCRLSAEYGLYRQDYCGCAFSKAEALRRKQSADH
jgi:predicted adenine nucleotide alpha hydrolase (AANH) superfamily ATPase